MKRRNFLSTVGVAVAVGASTQLSAATSAYTSLSSSAAMADFPAKAKQMMDGFVSDLDTCLEGASNKGQLVKNIASPVRIISKGDKHIIYKNRCGDYVKMGFSKGKQKIYIGKDLPKK